MICGSDGILAKPTNDNGKIANGSTFSLVHLNLVVEILFKGVEF